VYLLFLDLLFGYVFIINRTQDSEVFDAMQPNIWCFCVRSWCSSKKLVVTHLKPPFEFRLMGMQEENNDIFFIKLF